MEHKPFDTEKLIVEVEKRPAIYDKSLAHYSDKNLKEKLWEEVCEALEPNWKGLDGKERNVKGKDIQSKWKNLRDSFRKELNLQKSQSSRSGRRKKRKYLFFDQLLFLLPTIEARKTSGNNNPPEISDAEGLNEEPAQRKNNPEKSECKTRSSRKKKKPTYEESLLQILRESKQEEIDEDKHFLLSLHPTFKTMSPQQKFQAKIDIMQILQRITAFSPIHGTIHTHIPYPDTGITPTTSFQAPSSLQYTTQKSFLQIKPPIFRSKRSAKVSTQQQPIGNQTITSLPSQNSSSTSSEPSPSAPASPANSISSSDSDFVELH